MEIAFVSIAGLAAAFSELIEGWIERAFVLIATFNISCPFRSTDSDNSFQRVSHFVSKRLECRLTSC